MYTYYTCNCYICRHIYIYTDMFAAANRASIAFFGLEHLAYKKLAQHFLSARLTCWITRPSVGPAVSGVVDKAGGSWKSIRWCQTDESFVGAISRVSRVSPRMIILLVWELISSWREHFQLHPEKCSKLEKHIFFWVEIPRSRALLTMYIYIYTYIHTYVRTYVRTYIHIIYIYIYILHTYTYTYTYHVYKCISTGFHFQVGCLASPLLLLSKDLCPLAPWKDDGPVQHEVALALEY